MPDINATQPIRFEAGGIFRIYDGASLDVTVINREKGTLEIEQGAYEILDYQDRGVNQPSLEGDEQPSTVRLRVKTVKRHTNDLMQLGQARDTATGLKKRYNVDISVPDFKGAATGTKYTFTGVSFVRPPRIVEGTRFDLAEIELVSTNPQATYAAY